VAPSWGALDRYSAGAQETPYLEPHQWVASLSYRYFHSFRVFNSSGEDVTSQIPGNDTYVDLFDANVTYAVNRRLSFTLELPFQYGSRTNAFEHDGVHVHTMRATGIGDMRLSANFLLLDPQKNLDHNITLSLGVKAPTGDDSATDTSFRSTGPEERPVDSAIQPGDGGWGIVVSANAFAKVYKNTFAYANGFYLINPREMNGVETVNGDRARDIGVKINSVPDQVAVRSGITHTIWPAKGLSVSFGARWEGIPAHDFIGGSNGWRLPGYTVSVEPGISISHGRDFLGVTAPVAVYRYGVPSVPAVRTHNPNAGFASFSDFQINVTYSHLF